MPAEWGGRTVAALYVDTTHGPYPGLAGVECWGWATRDGRQLGFVPDRDADAYAGPWPVVAHPPCGPWGRLSHLYRGGEGSKASGVHAVAHVRRWGGVLEHPASSRLWGACAMPPPGAPTDKCGGWTLAVDQVRWGHKARKATWLYIVGTANVPPIPEDREPTHVIATVRRGGVAAGVPPRVPKMERHATPPAFARWLVELARRCGRD